MQLFRYSNAWVYRVDKFEAQSVSGSYRIMTSKPLGTPHHVEFLTKLTYSNNPSAPEQRVVWVRPLELPELGSYWWADEDDFFYEGEVLPFYRITPEHPLTPPVELQTI